MFNLVKILLQNVANIQLSNYPFYYFYHFLLSSNCSKYLASSYLKYVNISTSYIHSILQMFSMGSPNFSTFLQWRRTFPNNLQGALCVFKFKVWKFHWKFQSKIILKIIHYLPFQNKMVPITQRSESIRATSIHSQVRAVFIVLGSLEFGRVEFWIFDAVLFRLLKKQKKYLKCPNWSATKNISFMGASTYILVCSSLRP